MKSLKASGFQCVFLPFSFWQWLSQKPRVAEDAAEVNPDDFKTPSLRARGNAKTVQATPAVFDPRLPKTPFLRQAKRGERLVS